MSTTNQQANCLPFALDLLGQRQHVGQVLAEMGGGAVGVNDSHGLPDQSGGAGHPKAG